MDIIQEKKQLRQKLRQAMAGLAAEYRAEADSQILAQILGLPEYIRARVLFCYVGVGSEIDTRPVLQDALQRGKRICVPKCVARGVMEAREIRSLDELFPAKFGLLEPAEQAPCILPQTIDFGLIPCLSCTPEGIRLGYGGGYYDRYLAKSHFPAAVLCREMLLSRRLSQEAFDQQVPIIISERMVRRIEK